MDSIVRFATFTLALLIALKVFGCVGSEEPQTTETPSVRVEVPQAVLGEPKEEVVFNPMGLTE